VQTSAPVLTNGDGGSSGGGVRGGGAGGGGARDSGSPGRRRGSSGGRRGGSSEGARRTARRRAARSRRRTSVHARIVRRPAWRWRCGRPGAAQEPEAEGAGSRASVNGGLRARGGAAAGVEIGGARFRVGEGPASRWRRQRRDEASARRRRRGVAAGRRRSGDRRQQQRRIDLSRGEGEGERRS